MKVRTGAKLEFELENPENTNFESERSSYSTPTMENFADLKDNFSSQYPTDDCAQTQEDSSTKGSASTDGNERYIFHKVEYSDTMEGLALQYNISAREIKVFNELSSNEIYYLKEIRIPRSDLQNLHVGKADFNITESMKKEKIQTLKEFIDPKHAKSAQLYLEENNWDINMAFDNYKNDMKLEKRYQKQHERCKVRKNPYRPEELRIKKNK